MTYVAEVIELVGKSTKSWEDAAQVALIEANKTIRRINGIEVLKKTAKVDSNSGIKYHTNVKIAFGVENK